jgi:hypothetical protein
MNCLNYLFPSFKRKLHRTFTTPLSPVLLVSDRGEVPPGARPVPYLSFHARVGHNSRFIGLSDDDYEELGGVEYHALIVLLWIVSGVSTSPTFYYPKCVVYETTHLVLHRHAIDTVYSAFPVHVDVEMESQLLTSKPTPSY